MIEEAIDRILVDRFQMIDFEERVEQHLDVACDVVAARIDQRQRVGLKLLELVGDRPERVAQRLGSSSSSLTKIQPPSRVAMDRDQRMAGEVDIDEIALVADRDQLAVERVAPAVIAADEAAPLARRLP